MRFYHVASAVLVARGICNSLSQQSDRPLHQLYPRNLLRAEKKAEALVDARNGVLGSLSEDELTKKNSQAVHYVNTHQNLRATHMSEQTSLMPLDKVQFEDSSASDYPIHDDPHISMSDLVSKARRHKSNKLSTRLRSWGMFLEKVKSEQSSASDRLINPNVSEDVPADLYTIKSDSDSDPHTRLTRNQKKSYEDYSAYSQEEHQEYREHHSALMEAWKKIQEKLNHLPGHMTNSPRHTFQYIKNTYRKKMRGKKARKTQEKSQLPGRRDKTIEEEYHQISAKLYSRHGISLPEPRHQLFNDRNLASDPKPVVSDTRLAVANFKLALDKVGKLLADPPKETNARSHHYQPTQPGESNTIHMEHEPLGPELIFRGKILGVKGSLTPSNLAKEIVKEWRRNSKINGMQHQTAADEEILSNILSAAQRSARASSNLQVAWRHWRSFLKNFGAFSEPLLGKAVLEKVETWLEPRATFYLSGTPRLNAGELISGVSKILKDDKLKSIQQVILQKLTQPTQEIHGFVKSLSNRFYKNNKSSLQNLIFNRQEIGPEFEPSEDSVVREYYYYVFEKAFSDSLFDLHREATQYMEEIIAPPMNYLLSDAEKTRYILISWVERIIDPPDWTNHMGESIRKAALKRLFEHFYGLHEGPEEIAKRLRIQFNPETRASSESILHLISKFTEKGIFTPEKEVELISAAKESHQKYLEKLGTEKELIAKLMAGTRKIAINEANQSLSDIQREEIGSRIMSLLTSKYMAMLDGKSRSGGYLIKKIPRHKRDEDALLDLSERVLKSKNLYGKENVRTFLEDRYVENDILEEFKIVNPVSDFFPPIQNAAVESKGGELETFGKFLEHIKLPEWQKLDLEISQNIKKIGPEKLLIKHEFFDHWYPKAEGIARLELVRNDARLKGTLFESLNHDQIKKINSNVKAIYQNMDYFLTLGRKVVKYEAEIERNIEFIKDDADVLQTIMESKILKIKSEY